MIILASSSPRRKELLTQVVKDFKIVVSDIDESEYLSLPYEDAVKEIAFHKGEKIHQQYPHDVVISADTIVVINNQIIGKPKDKEDAKRILKLLSNNTHLVLTSYHILKDELHIENTVISEVVFYPLSDKFIDDYIKTGSPLDKAGAYGVQDDHSHLMIKEVKGSVNNVIGFPIEEIKNDLIKNRLL